MTKDEALHKALKVLNCLNNDRVYETAWVKGAINACEEALEQPAQEPVGYLQEQSPNGKGFFATYLPMKDMKNKPLYTHPHQDGTSPSKWTALTDDEIARLSDEVFGSRLASTLDDSDFKFAHAIEQALKEKNAINA